MKFLEFLDLVAFFLIALGIPRLMPYDYYTLMRVVNFLIFGFIAFKIYKVSKNWAFMHFSLCILFNPVLPLRLGKTSWIIVDLGAMASILLFVLLCKPDQIMRSE